jgi:hypothetical protein
VPSHPVNPATSVVIPLDMAGVGEVEVVAHHERATLRVGYVYLKIDADQGQTDVIPCLRFAPSWGRHWAASASRRPRRPRRVPRTGTVQRAAAAMARPEPRLVFMHGDLQVGDLQVAHVFVDGDVTTCVADWSEAG